MRREADHKKIDHIGTRDMNTGKSAGSSILLAGKGRSMGETSTLKETG